MKYFFITHKTLAIVLLQFLLQSVTSLNDVYLNDLSLKTVESLLNILGNYKNDVKYIIIEPNNRKPKESRGNSIGVTNRNKMYNERIIDYEDDKKFQRPGRHILIKRLLPHGFPPSKLEFDSKFKAYYRPLVRVHKSKVLPRIETILNLDGTTDGRDKYGIDFYDYFDNDENILKFVPNKEPSENLTNFKAAENFDADEELLQPFATDFDENNEITDEISTQLKILGDIQILLRKIRSKFSKTQVYNAVTRALDELVSLRSDQKSGEDNDPMAPGKLVNLQNDIVDESPPKPKKWIPHYAPWNFWTYNKIIYQDVCPKGQVKMANLCVWVPPH